MFQHWAGPHQALLSLKDNEQSQHYIHKGRDADFRYKIVIRLRVPSLDFSGESKPVAVVCSFMLQAVEQLPRVVDAYAFYGL